MGFCVIFFSHSHWHRLNEWMSKWERRREGWTRTEIENIGARRLLLAIYIYVYSYMQCLRVYVCVSVIDLYILFVQPIVSVQLYSSMIIIIILGGRQNSPKNLQQHRRRHSYRTKPKQCKLHCVTSIFSLSQLNDATNTPKCEWQTNERTKKDKKKIEKNGCIDV